MKKTVKYVDEDTLEIKETVVDDNTSESEYEFKDLTSVFEQALGCDPYEFEEKYEKFKKAEAEFNSIYEPFKDNLIKLHQEKENLPKSIIIGGIKCTYVSPSTRSSIDTKKLKEEEPELAKKYMKTSNIKSSVRIEGPMLEKM